MNRRQRYELMLDHGPVEPWWPRLSEAELSALWAGDVDALYDTAPCICCCADHTFAHCRARLWNGCRSGLEFGDDGPYGRQEIEAWAEHYGMTRDEFCNHTACRPSSATNQKI